MEDFCFCFLFLFYLPYLSSIHEKANCIAILWTGSPHSLGSCLFRGLWATCLPHKGGRFHHDINIEQYVQIVHINSSYWITLSNVFCESTEYQAAAGCPVRPVGYGKVYDSFLSVAKQEKKLVILLLWKSGYRYVS